MKVLCTIVLLWFMAQDDVVLGKSILTIKNSGSIFEETHDIDEDIDQGRLRDAFYNMCISVLRNDNEYREELDIESMGLILRTSCNNVSLPISHAEAISKSPDFDIKTKVAIYVSGWMTTPEDDHITDMAKAFNCRGDYNFMVFNTSNFLHKTLYPLSAYNTKEVGNQLAKDLAKLVDTVPVENIHLIGHSLGAHVVGYAGEFFKEYTNVSLPRITGLDPAEPGFYEEKPFVGLQSSAAKFVDVIHTNPGELGKETTLGHADFYETKSGLFSPGCEDISCSHRRSNVYFIESIYRENENNFLAVDFPSLNAGQCKSPQYPMGLAVSQDLKGKYVFSANAQKTLRKKS